MRVVLSFVAAAVMCCSATLFAQDVNPQEKIRSFEEYAPWLDPSLELRDYHIHLRGGMTPERAVERAKKTGVKSGVLENTGSEWPLSTNEILDKFVADIESLNATLPEDERLKIGVQVNDRDWYKTIDLKIYRRLDFVLADTMIMTEPDGTNTRLWLLPKDYDVDQDEWFERYFQHCMTVVSEPIDILANVTYLPEFIASRYDELWTEERMTALIQAAIDNNVALEIQAESAFPQPKFIELALKMGAKFSFGSNNHDAALKDASVWKKRIEEFNIQKDSLWKDSSK